MLVTQLHVNQQILISLAKKYFHWGCTWSVDYVFTADMCIVPSSGSLAVPDASLLLVVSWFTPWSWRSWRWNGYVPSKCRRTYILVEIIGVTTKNIYSWSRYWEPQIQPNAGCSRTLWIVGSYLLIIWHWTPEYLNLSIPRRENLKFYSLT
jgi:hypothetical protein